MTGIATLNIDISLAENTTRDYRRKQIHDVPVSQTPDFSLETRFFSSSRPVPVNAETAMEPG